MDAAREGGGNGSEGFVAAVDGGTDVLQIEKRDPAATLDFGCFELSDQICEARLVDEPARGDDMADRPRFECRGEIARARGVVATVRPNALRPNSVTTRPAALGNIKPTVPDVGSAATSLRPSTRLDRIKRL
jgi:hypothetical protein